MANRAYLYFSNTYQVEQLTIQIDEYIDSRHNIPILWLLLFNKDALKPIIDKLDCDILPQEQLTQRWEICKENILNRKELVDRILLTHNLKNEFTPFLELLESYSKCYLHLDFSEILESDEDIKNCYKMLINLDDTHVSVSDRFKSLREFCHFSILNDDDRNTLNVYGASYL